MIFDGRFTFKSPKYLVIKFPPRLKPKQAICVDGYFFTKLWIISPKSSVWPKKQEEKTFAFNKHVFAPTNKYSRNGFAVFWHRNLAAYRFKSRQINFDKNFHVFVSCFDCIKQISLTISENSRRCDLYRIDHSNVVQHGASVSMALSVVNKSPDVDAFRTVADTGTHSHRNVVLVLQVQRLIKIIRKSGSIVQGNEHAFTQGPWAVDATHNTMQYGLYVTTKSPQSSWNVTAKNGKEIHIKTYSK